MRFIEAQVFERMALVKEVNFCVERLFRSVYSKELGYQLKM